MQKLKRKIKSISISVSDCEKNPYCIYTSEQSFEKHVDLLLILIVRNLHY